MKKCELCRLPASLYCESDRASLCAGCDLKVHEANFLVARHSRRLLCKRCQCPTPWVACGARLGNTVTECDQCAGEADEIISGGGGLVDEEAFDDEVYGDEEDNNEEEEGENQVVPLMTTTTASSSTGDDDASSCSPSACASRSTLTPLKRMRECDDVTDHNRPLQNSRSCSTDSDIARQQSNSNFVGRSG